MLQLQMESASGPLLTFVDGAANVRFYRTGQKRDKTIAAFANIFCSHVL
jgi:hypothetical protein